MSLAASAITTTARDVDVHWLSFGVAFGVLALFWLIYNVVARNRQFGTGGFLGLGQLVEGADGRPSTSKFQFVLWTGVVLFSWVAIYVARVQHGDWQAVPDLPQNLLIAMGLSVTTVTTAKGITVGYLASQHLVKPDGKPETKRASAIFQDDTGFPDLSKIQMVAWTLIAIAAYLPTVWVRVDQVGRGTAACSSSPSRCGLPDIDGALMVLMGLGQGAYLGKKLTVMTPIARLRALAPANGKPGDPITIYGGSFGATQNGSLITLDGTPLAGVPQPWQDTQIRFAIPDRHPNGADWTKPQQVVDVGVSTYGLDSANSLPLTVNS